MYILLCTHVQEHQYSNSHCDTMILLLPCAHAQGVKQSVCTPVVVVVVVIIVVVGMKIATLGDLGI